MGMTRRVYTYGWDLGWAPLNLVSTIGAFLMGIGFIFQVWQIIYSVKHGERDVTGDPWDGRTLEWSIPSPAPLYNFAHLPYADKFDSWHETKEDIKAGKKIAKPDHYEPIHMPKDSAIPFIFSICFFIAGFGFTFNWIWMGVLGMIGVVICLISRSFQYDVDYYIPAEEVERTETALGRGL
jgi:cytochrome aa3-600 menaquinol oxidase subunit 1